MVLLMTLLCSPLSDMTTARDGEGEKVHPMLVAIKRTGRGYDRDDTTAR